MHALPARPHIKVWRGLTHMRSMCVGVAETGHRGSNMRADGTIIISPISLCSHPDLRQNINREVCHSLTWHSSESESALKRFEPVVVVQQLPDGRSTLFALVAARRQKKLKEESVPLFVLFVLFGQAKRTLKEKNHNVTFPLSYFCVTKRRVQGGEATSERRRRTKSHLRGLSPLSRRRQPTHCVHWLIPPS